jgi:hypothetical protein
VELTVVLLITIGLACVIGTLIPQANSVGGSSENVYAFYVGRYGPTLHFVFNTLSFYQLYSSWWFSVLLVTLAISMIVCSLRRLRGRWQQVGFQLTHLSIVFLVVGVLIGLNSQEGMMKIDEGGESDTISLGQRSRVANTLDQARQLAAKLADAGNTADLRLDFAIHLNDFELRRQSKPLDAIRVQSALGGPIRSYNIAFQKTISRAAGESWDIEVLGTQPIRRTVEMVKETTGTGESAIEIELAAEGHRHTDWVFARGPRQRRVLTDTTEIEYRSCRSRIEWERLLGENDVPTTATPDYVEVTRERIGATTLPLRLGVEQSIAGSSLTLTVLRFLPHWQMDLQTRQITSLSPERHNPAIQVQARQGDAVETRWLFSRDPLFHGQTGLLGAAMELRFVEADLMRTNFLRVLSLADSRERFLQRYLNGHLVETVTAEAGRRIGLPGEGEVGLRRWIERATVESKEEDAPDRFAARLLVRNRTTGRTEEIEAASGEVLARGQLRFLLEREYPIDQFISHVGVIENGQTVLSKTVQMNDPLKYRGYTFYQSSYDTEAGAASRYTVLSVTRDPGVWSVYAGFGMLTVGLVIVFYVNPWLTRRRKEQA